MSTIQLVLKTLLILFTFQLAVLNCPSLGSNVLLTGFALYAGDRLTYEEYSLILQSDCNLVLKNGTKTIWETMTGGSHGDWCHLVVSYRGKLTLYDSVFKELWNSKTESELGRYVLVLRYDGTLHVYGPRLWTASSSSAQALSTIGAGFAVAAGSATVTDAVLYSGDVAPIGTTIVNGDNVLTLLRDCNLVRIYRGVKSWETGVTDDTFHDCYVNLEGNGEFRVKHWGGDVLWTNGVKSSVYAEFVLALGPYGSPGVYGPSLWSTSSESGNRKPSTDHEIQMVTDELTAT